LSTTIYIYISKTNFLQENKEARGGSRFSVQRFWVIKFRAPELPRGIELMGGDHLGHEVRIKQPRVEVPVTG
jgi:hypothetical protein